jgi:flagellar basal body-associated protein FliL
MADSEDQEEEQGKKKSGMIVTIAVVLVLSGAGWRRRMGRWRYDCTAGCC